MFGFSKREREARASLENPSVSLVDVSALSAAMGEWWHSASDVVVTDERALSVPSFTAATNFISGTVAALPLDMYERGTDGRTAVSSGLGALLHDAVNDELTSFQWRKQAMMHVLAGGGRSYSFIERNVAGRVINLWLLDPTCVTPERVGGKKRYRYIEGGKTVFYKAAEIIDIPFMLKPDGLTHYNPVQLFKNALGLSIALEQYASRFFQNGGVPPLQLVGPLKSPAGIKRAATDITAALKAAREEGRAIMPMPDMHELKSIGIDPDKGQMTEARKFQLLEIARIFQLPPMFLQDLEFGTFSNTEQQDLHFVKHTLMQWLKLWEQEMNLKLFSARNTKNFVEFNVDGLLRGDFASRMSGYATGIQNAILKPDEAREMENRPKAKYGDNLFIQGATVPLSDPAAMQHRPKTDQAQPGDTVTPDPAVAPEPTQDQAA